MAIKRDGQRTKRGRRKHLDQETPKEAEHSRPMTMVDPWDMLLEQLMVEPMDDGGSKNRPTAQAQPEAGSAVRPKRPKKGRKGSEQE